MTEQDAKQALEDLQVKYNALELTILNAHLVTQADYDALKAQRDELIDLKNHFEAEAAAACDEKQRFLSQAHHLAVEWERTSREQRTRAETADAENARLRSELEAMQSRLAQAVAALEAGIVYLERGGLCQFMSRGLNQDMHLRQCQACELKRQLQDALALLRGTREE